MTLGYAKLFGQTLWPNSLAKLFGLTLDPCKPNQQATLALLPPLARAEGRLHFAGEHTSAWPGWMQGALASGQRVARAINATP